MTKQSKESNFDNQDFYYKSIVGLLLGSKAREKLIVQEIQKLNKKNYFLEVGCAQGHYLSKAIKKTKHTYGVDVSKDFIEKSKKTKAICFVSSAEKLPFKKEMFNIVLCTEVLEHVPNWKKAVKEIKRVLKKGGHAIITIPLEKAVFWRIGSIFFPPKKTRGHINLLNSKEIEKEFLKKNNNFIISLEKKQLIQTPSSMISKVFPKKENLSMYCFFVFNKN